MLRKILIAIGVLLCFLLQSVMFPNLKLGHVMPNLLLILTSVCGFMRGEKSGIWVGFFCGLLSDIFFGDFLGFNALLYLYIGYLNEQFNGVFYPEDIRLPLALITLSDLSYGTLYYIFMFLVRGKLSITHYFLHVIFPEMFYTILVAIPVYLILLKIDTSLSLRERRKEEKNAG